MPSGWAGIRFMVAAASMKGFNLLRVSLVICCLIGYLMLMITVRQIPCRTATGGGVIHRTNRYLSAVVFNRSS